MTIDRDLMKAAGYYVHGRTSHVGPAWDFSAPGKGSMDAHIYKTEEEAWKGCEARYQEDVKRAEALLQVGRRWMPLGPGYRVRIVGDVMDACPATAGDLPWAPIDESTPRGEYLLLRGASGYGGTPHRYIVARHDAGFRPHRPWVDYAGDSVLDGGEMPTEWVRL